MNKTVSGAIIILLLLAAATWFLFPPPLSEAEQIVRLLKDTQAAANSGNTRRVLYSQSEQYSGAGGTKRQVRLLLIQAAREGDISLTLNTPTVTVTGDSATVELFAQAALRQGPGSETRINSDVTLALRKEDGKRLLVLPARVWRIVSADVRTGTEGFF